ncbi:autotransporter-associated beta strand repeat-containing protein, partial [Pelomonas sp. KK5]|uniref:autotransporter-associated beta strand repeat-containing protein n=1 Tax=Pelomonas sp. KK5 TaxID=1855730 RepID=UPI00117DB6A2
ETPVALGLAALNGAGTMTLSSADALLSVGSGSFTGRIEGAGALTKTGSGTLLLSGSNSFSGPVSVELGTLQLDGGAALADTARISVAAPAQLTLLAGESVAQLSGSGRVQLDNGSRIALGSDGSDSRFDGVIAGSGSLAKQGSGTLILTGANSYTG